MDSTKINSLIDIAKKASDSNFCCKYSNFSVGAALMDKDGNVYSGFNVENQGIQSICAERTAFVKALTSGAKDFVAIAVVGKKLGEIHFAKTLPCGYCRQFMSEYATPDFLIYTIDDATNKIYTYTLSELLPEAFRDF